MGVLAVAAVLSAAVGIAQEEKSRVVVDVTPDAREEYKGFSGGPLKCYGDNSVLVLALSSTDFTGFPGRVMVRVAAVGEGLERE